MLEVVVVAFWVMLPSYLPNNAAVVFGGGRPIDGGRTLGGRRLLGDGKTWRGTTVGILVGALLAVVLNAVAPTVDGVLGVTIPRFPAAVAVTLPTGAMLGDIAGSLVKRRTGRKRGAPWPGFDQLDFVVGALALTAVVDLAWFSETFLADPLVLVVVVVLTPLLHVGTNAAAYLLGMKDVPY